MLLTRIQSYKNYKSIAEHLYLGNDHTNAIKKFRSQYPEHDECILIASTIDSEDTAQHEYINTMLKLDLVG